MNAHHKDLRMVDDLDQTDEVRSLLRAGIDDDVAGFDFERGLSAHIAAVAALPPAVPNVPPPAVAAAGISGKALIAWIGVPVASASVIAALWFGGSAETPSTTSPAASNSLNAIAKTVPIVAAPSAEPTTTPSAPEVVAPTQPSSATNTVTRGPSVRAQRNAAVTRDVKPATQAPATVARAESAVAADNAVADSTETEATVATPTLEAEPTAAEREAMARVAAQQAEQERAAREEARRVAEERLKREMAQLMQAKQALTGNPARALSLAQAGEQEFRNSLFSEERQHVLLLALIKLGRVDEAERRAQPFLSAHPDSPFARSIRNALQAAK